MKMIADMRLAKAFVLLLALFVSACGGGPRQVAELPVSPTRQTARPTMQKPLAPTRAVAPSASTASGPLTLARIGNYMDGLETDLRRHVHGDGIVVSRQGDAITVVIRNDLLFSGDGGIAGDAVLEPLGAILGNYAHTTVQVNGFTDTSGTPEQNLAVSQKRAKLIADALAHEGVPPARLIAQGFGAAHLRVATGDNKKEPRNRRIEILLKAKPG